MSIALLAIAQVIDALEGAAKLPRHRVRQLAHRSQFFAAVKLFLKGALIAQTDTDARQMGEMFKAIFFLTVEPAHLTAVLDFQNAEAILAHDDR